MKIKTKRVSVDYALQTTPPEKGKLKKPSLLWNTLIRILSAPTMWKTKFTCVKKRMEYAKGPCLILMNHSCFVDMKILSRIFYPKRYFIVGTTDSLVGKKWLMKKIGILPTQKFIADATLPRDINRALHDLKTSVVVYPEAGYSFDGRTTALPQSLGALVKKLGVPLVTVITDGAFLRQPLYNNLHIRKTKLSAEVECLLTPEETKEKSVQEINALIADKFSFNAFKAQAEHKIAITEPTRAEGLQRILYRCPACETEGEMIGEGITLSCKACGKTYQMNEYGELQATSGETEFASVPDWFDYERECVRREIEAGEYKLDLPVEIAVLSDCKALYQIGAGRLVHDQNGFVLTAEDGRVLFTQSPLSSYSLNADFNWYEIGDVIGIGDKKRLFYCFPQTQKDVVTKARFAAEELYKKRKAELQNK